MIAFWILKCSFTQADGHRMMKFRYLKGDYSVSLLEDVRMIALILLESVECSLVQFGFAVCDDAFIWNYRLIIIDENNLLWLVISETANVRTNITPPYTAHKQTLLLCCISVY